MGKTTTARSKSERAREMFKAGAKVSDVEKRLGMGYAFAYGVAKRLAASDPEFNLRSVAGERSRRAVRVLDSGAVVIAVTTGWVRVAPDGTVKRSKSEPKD